MKSFHLKKLLHGLCMILLFLSVSLAFGKTEVHAATASGQVPLTTYTLSGKVLTYNSVGASKDAGYIASNDRVTVLQIRQDGWSKVRYPGTRGLVTRYCRSNQLFCNVDFSTNQIQLGQNKTVYTRSGLTSQLGTVYGQDMVTIIGDNGRNTQIIYPISGGYKMGWISGRYSSGSSGVRTDLSDAEVKKFTFHAKYYADRYYDLKQAFGYNESSLYKHWLNHGIKEGRCASPILDLQYYVRNNGDLSRAFGSDYRRAYEHFLVDGYKEGRNSSEYYYGIHYRNTYNDLKPYSFRFLMNHYLDHGISEGRIANNSRKVPTFDKNWSGGNTSGDQNNGGGLASPVPSGAKFSKKTNDNGWFGYHDINRGIRVGTPVYAITDGTVTYKQAYRIYNGTKYLTSYGNYIEFTANSGGYNAKYCHLNGFQGVKQIISSSRTKRVSGSTGTYHLGTRNVRKGEVIGYIGTTGNSSGPHLHFELRKNGSRIDPTSEIGSLV